jgi:hypothetical protein
MSDSNNQAAKPAARWATFEPPKLPEANKLKAAVERARKMTPKQVLQVSVSAGIHNADGSLTEKYR